MLIAYNYSATEMSQLEKQNDLKISVLYGQQCIMNYAKIFQGKLHYE